VVVVAAAVGEDTAAVAEASAAELTWVVVSAEATWVVSVEATWVASAELTWEVLAELARLAWAEVTMAMDGIVASTTTAIAARMTRITPHTIRTPAPTEW
jgi:hypothetical protein